MKVIAGLQIRRSRQVFIYFLESFTPFGMDFVLC